MSTFTNWDGPQNGPARSDWRELIQDYKDIINQLGEKQDRLTFDSTPEQGSTNPVTSNGIWNVFNALQNGVNTLNNLLSHDYETKEAAEAKYQTKVANIASTNDIDNAIAALAIDQYLKTNELTQQQVIQDLTAAVSNLTAEVDAEVVEKDILKALEYVEGMIHAVEQVQFTFKEFGATVGGSDTVGVYYLLGMIDERAGTAYIRFTDTDSFAAVVNFTVTAELDAQGNVTDYTNGQLSVVTDVANLTNVHFKIVKGTADGKQHVYLAIQADEWLQNFASTDGVGLFNTIPFEAAGINFIPVGSEGYVPPTGATEVLFDYDYFALEDRMSAMEQKLVNITSLDDAGSIIGWTDMNNIPAWAHACDGTAIDPSLTELIAKVGPNYPLIDYHIMQIRNTVEV